MKSIYKLASAGLLALALSSCPAPQPTVYETETIVLPYPSKPASTRPVAPARPTYVNPAQLEATGPYDR